jgi:hypothetical protein
MATPLAGAVELTVSTCVVGGGGVVVPPPPPPQAVMKRLSPIPIHNAASRLKFIISMLLIF